MVEFSTWLRVVLNRDAFLNWSHIRQFSALVFIPFTAQMSINKQFKCIKNEVSPYKNHCNVLGILNMLNMRCRFLLGIPHYLQRTHPISRKKIILKFCKLTHVDSKVSSTLTLSSLIVQDQSKSQLMYPEN